MHNTAAIYKLIDEYVPYFTKYFRDLNTGFRDIRSGQTMTKGLLLAHIFYYRLNGD